ncbi:hypothetical protein ACE1SV_13750 [Streptomyces sp. E-15]
MPRSAARSASRSGWDAPYLRENPETVCRCAKPGTHTSRTQEPSNGSRTSVPYSTPHPTPIPEHLYDTCSSASDLRERPHEEAPARTGGRGRERRDGVRQKTCTP